MSETVISARGVSKTYTIAHQQQKATTLAEALVQRLRNPLGSPTRETFQALKEISFEVNRGEVIGIIGRNGAGKSTLLKILSQITQPTAGEIDLTGRIGSLLEVGTGFHPELTGRENIYLNGAILGMSRREIGSKFDEIVAFSEVEEFLDTPVKRYSSGMYVRLAFAVAAHLETEILLVDEVLAVGDVQFQKKCLGKMNEISSSQGRTILFVSHNVAATRALCSRVLLLDHGRLTHDGRTDEVLDAYLEQFGGESAEIRWEGEQAPQSREFDFVFRRAWVENEEGIPASNLSHDQPFTICVEYETGRLLPGLRIGFFMQNSQGTGMCGSNDVGITLAADRVPGCYVSRCRFPGRVLNEDRYQIQFGADTFGGGAAEHLCLLTPFAVTISIEDFERHQGGSQKLPGVVRPSLEWKIEPALPVAKTKS